MIKKLSYILVIAGITLILFPKAREIYYDWEQTRLLKQMDTAAPPARTHDANDETSLAKSYDHLNRLLDEGDDSQAGQDDGARSEQDLKLLEDQHALGILTIDKIGVKLPILEGATKKNMKYAAAHLPETAPLGQDGNAAIAAHRAHTKGRLFNRLNEMAVGDSIQLRLQNGQTETYSVYKVLVVEPTEVSVLQGSSEERTLTLITCDPLINPTHRLIVKARAQDAEPLKNVQPKL